MNKEEKNAIEYYQNKEVSFSADFDTEKLLKALGITEEDSFQNHQIRFKTLLNLIEKLQKENEELKKYKEYYSSAKQLVDNNYIHKQKVKDKIEELIEDEIDSIEETTIRQNYGCEIINEDNIYLLFKTQNELVKAVKQIDKRVKKLEKE